MQTTPSYGSWSLAAAAATVLLAQLFHPILLFPVQEVGTAAWLTILLAGLGAMAALWPVAAMLQSRVKGNLIDLADAAAGVPGQVFTAVALTAVLVYHCGAVLRETAEMAISAVYPHTPQTFAVVTLTLCLLYGAWGGFATLVRLCRLFLPALVIAILFAVAGSFGWGELRFLLPLWGHGPRTMLTSLPQIMSNYETVLVLLMGAGQLRDRAHLFRAGAATLAFTSIMLSATALVLVMVFPLPLGYSITFPLHEMARIVSGGRFFERMDGVWVCIWVFGTACHLAVLVHVAAQAWAQAFRLSSHTLAVLPLTAVVLTLAFFPPDQGRTLVWHAAEGLAVVAVTFALPLLLAVWGWLRIRREHR